LELAEDPDIIGTDIRTLPAETPTEGVGIVEAPRGTLTHHYVTDERGLLTKVNLIVGTTNNYAAIDMSIKKAAQGLIKSGAEISEAVLNQIEMAFRAYDPCFGCATHALPGRQPFLLRVFDHDRELVQEILRE
jgi:F420-non-reducing hydrogenase large subunit